MASCDVIYRYLNCEARQIVWFWAPCGLKNVQGVSPVFLDALVAEELL